MKRMVLICGPSGIGKSTLAEALVDKMGGVWRESDTYFIDEETMEYKWDPAKLALAHGWCRQEVEDFMIAGSEHIVVSNTFTRVWERKPYIDLAIKYGYEVVIIHMGGLMPKRLAELSTHKVPVSTIERMVERYE